MEQKLICDTVKDLLPMYVESMTSEASNRLIEEHVETCGECRTVLEQMKQPIDAEKAPEVKELKKYLKKSKLSIFYWGMGIIALLSVITCFIVNLAVENRLSWFYIVVMGIVTAYLPAYFFISAAKHRLVKALAALNLCTVGLLAVIQIVVYSFMGTGGVWFWNPGMPITLVWSAAVWIGIACNLFLHANVLLSGAVFLFLSVGANYITNVLAGGYQNKENYLYNALGFVIAGIIALISGIIVQSRGKSRKMPEQGGLEEQDKNFS